MPVKTYIDTETCGLHCVPVLLQYAVDGGPIRLYEPWREPVGNTLALLERIADSTVVGFNLTFDWFHLCKLYTMFRLLPPGRAPDIAQAKAVELEARDGPFLKPRSALDLLLHSRKGPYQSLMARKDIRIRKVPASIAWQLADELAARVEIDGIYFARSKDGPRWRVADRDDDPAFKDVVLKFHPGGGLKQLAEHALGYKPKYAFEDIEIDAPPEEYGYAPAHGNWPAVIHEHIHHWATNAPAREYATDDIVYTRGLDEYFGYPEPGDDDSVLACAVAAIRWRGFEIDAAGIAGLLQEAREVVAASPVTVTKPAEVRAYIMAACDEVEQTLLGDLAETTERAVLEEIATSDIWQGHPASARCREVLDVKFAVKEVELYEKLLKAGRFHAAFTIIGTKSNRMSGAGGDLNPQAIKATKRVRSQFPLAWKGYQLAGGDFDSFEVAIADAVYGDAKLRAILQGPKKIHALFAQQLYPGKSYYDIVSTKDTKRDLYLAGKKGVFAEIYFGDESTHYRNLKVPIEVARAAHNWWLTNFPDIGKARQRVVDKHSALRQPGGIGSRVEWNDPAEYVESMLGFRRYFTLEIKICRALYDLAQNPPQHWKVAGKVRRFDREQSVRGAVSSALYGAAFAISGAMVRAAGNHEVQSPGAQITKRLQRRLWDLQPVGACEPVVAPMNVHDEVACPCKPWAVHLVEAAVIETVESYRQYVPLIGMTWFSDMANWAEKKAGATPVKIAAPLDVGNMESVDFTSTVAV